MPLPFIHSTTSLFGLAYTGFRGLILGGAWTPSPTITGPRPNPSGVAVVQPGPQPVPGLRFDAVDTGALRWAAPLRLAQRYQHPSLGCGLVGQDDH